MLLRVNASPLDPSRTVSGMRALVFGATGMVGQGVLRECLADAQVTEVLVVGRSEAPQRHPKLTQIVRPDLFDLSDAAGRLTGFDVCFFCLGVSSAGMKQDEYRHLTHDLTLAIATVLAPLNPTMVFEYVSGEGTDSTEQGSTMWARVKGATENALLALPFAAYAIRPGFIRPPDGVRSKTRVYAVMYRTMGFLYPVIRRLIPKYVITAEELGQGMIRIAAERPEERIWPTAALVELARTP